MKLTIDTEQGIIRTETEELPLYSREGFERISDLWVAVGWNEKYSYTFSWMGMPIIQLPEDMIRYQELICRVRPDVIIETGVAHGGSLVYSAGLCTLLGKGRVIGIDIAIRPANRQRIESHPMAGKITLLEGSSTSPGILEAVRQAIGEGESVLVVLDSDHSYRHVSAELEAYAPLVTPGSYIVATDGVMQDLTEVPRGQKGWHEDNPAKAARDFATKSKDFVLEEPVWPFNESGLGRRITHWPDAYLRRK